MFRSARNHSQGINSKQYRLTPLLCAFGMVQKSTQAAPDILVSAVLVIAALVVRLSFMYIL
jgi:hypothetical protein